MSMKNWQKDLKAADEFLAGPAMHTKYSYIIFWDEETNSLCATNGPDIKQTHQLIMFLETQLKRIQGGYDLTGMDECLKS